MSAVTVVLDTTDWQWVLDTFAFPATEQGQRVRAAIAAAIPAPPPAHVPYGVLALALSADGATVHASAAPEGTKTLHVAFSTAQSGGTSEYRDFPLEDAAHLATAIGAVFGSTYPWVSAEARNGEGKSLSGWTARTKLTVAGPAPEEPHTSAFTPGLVTNSDNTVPGLLHPRVVRSEYSIDTAAATVAALAKAHHEAGRVFQPLAGFHGRIPSEAEAKALKAWAEACRAYGATAIEFGNETNGQITNNKANGEAYGRMARLAVFALAGTGVGLLVQASDFGNPGGEWGQGVLNALGGTRPLGYTIHPYPGQASATGTDGWGLPMMERLVKLLESRNDPTSIYATEWGPTSDNGRTLSDGKAYNYEGAAYIIAHHSAALKERAKGRLAQLLIYQSHDQAPSGATTNREAYFGAVKVDGSAKGAMTTAVQTFLAS